MRAYRAIPIAAAGLFAAACSDTTGTVPTRSLTPQPPTRAVGGVSGASFTTVNPGVDGPGTCLNGTGLINCNIYTDKQFVWIEGGPIAAALGDGTYFFAVLVPGGQNNDVNDGSGGGVATNKNLSDDVDTYADRTFTVSGGVIAYAGPHQFDPATHEIRLANYLTTTNPGGEYDVAVCRYVPASYNPATSPIDPNTCKYDNFKVKATTVNPPPHLAVTKTATASYQRQYAWSIQKAVDKSSFTLLAGSATATANYTVTVNTTGFTDSKWVVSGSITVSNDGGVAALINSVTDATLLGNATTDCGAGVTFPYSLTVGGTLTCAYSLSLATKPTYDQQYTNTARALVADPDGGSDLAFIGTAPFTFASASPTKVIDNCVAVSDTYMGALGTVCIGQTLPKSFTYSRTFGPFATSDCGTTKPYPNTASFTSAVVSTYATPVTGSSSANVNVSVRCQACTPGYWKNNLAGWLGTGFTPGTSSPQTGTLIDSYTPYAFGVASGTAPSDLSQYLRGTKTLGKYSMLEGLAFQGGTTLEGKGEILLRAGTAALLNASYSQGGHTFVYPLTAAQVRTMVNGALSSLDGTAIVTAANTLDGYNNSGACPLNAQGVWTGQF